MAAGRKGERTELCFLHFRRSNFPERGAADKVFGLSLPSAAALLVCTSGGLEGMRAIFFIQSPPLEVSEAMGGA